jgi:excisionase family DNA binding protein
MSRDPQEPDTPRMPRPIGTATSGAPPGNAVRSRKAPLLDAFLTELDDAEEAVKQGLADRLLPFLDASPTQLLNASTKAKQLGLHPETLVKMARAGRIEGARKIGREWRFPAEVCEVRPLAYVPGQNSPPPPRRRRKAQRASVSAIRGGSLAGATRSDARAGG